MHRIDPQLLPVPDGQTGEIAIRGPRVMKGDDRNPEAPAAAFPLGGWPRTHVPGHRAAPSLPTCDSVGHP